jgi:serine O-acetyltransferase
LELGFGACIIGSVTLGNGVTVGANAVVVKSDPEDDITLVGVPARKK